MRWRPGTRVQVADGSGLDSGKKGRIIPRNQVPTRSTGGGVIPDLPGHYKPMRSDEEAIRLDNGQIITMFRNRLIRLMS